MSYNKVVKSKLSFKGSSGKLPGIGKGVKRRLDSSSSSAASSAGKDEFGPIGVSEERGEISIENGIGRITSSGTTVHGHETKFMDQVDSSFLLFLLFYSALHLIFHLYLL